LDKSKKDNPNLVGLAEGRATRKRTHVFSTAARLALSPGRCASSRLPVLVAAVAKRMQPPGRTTSSPRHRSSAASI